MSSWPTDQVRAWAAHSVNGSLNATDLSGNVRTEFLGKWNPRNGDDQQAQRRTRPDVTRGGRTMEPQKHYQSSGT